jgi:amidase
MPYQGDLIGLTATAAVDLLKAREVSPLDLIEAAARRIADVDAKINALPLRFFDRAREAAKRLPSKRAARMAWRLTDRSERLQ